MPKKTKKEKLIAEYRRKLQSLPQLSQTSPLGDEIKPSQRDIHTSSSYTLQTPPQPKHVHEVSSVLTPDQQQEFSAIRKDLNWTLILVALMLSVEFGIWKIVG